MLKKSFVKKFFVIISSLIIFVIVVILFLLLFRIVASYYSVSEIILKGNNSSNEIRGIEEYKKKNILLLSEKEIGITIKKQNPYVQNVIVEKQYPNRLILSISYYSPFAKIKTRNGYFILSDDARILVKIKKDTYALPLITYYQQIDYYEKNAGEYLEYKDIEKAVYLLKNTLDLGLKVDTVDINNINMILLKISDTSVIFTTEKNIKIQIYELEIIIQEFKRKGKNFKKIDLRFDKPIVVMN